MSWFESRWKAIPNPKVAWEAVSALHWRGTRDVLAAALRLCQSPAPLQRARGADILGQLGIPNRAFPEETLNALLPMLRRDEEPAVLNSIATALGHMGDARAVPALCDLAVHPSDEVRFGVVFGLLGQEDSEAIAGLIRLSADADPEVRDWATFGLGSQIDTDTPDIREALAARLSDSNANAAAEAMVGLARRRDRRARPFVIKTLESGRPGNMDLEAAEELADPSLLPALRALEPLLGDDSDLERAIAACSGREVGTLKD
jgi:HEAT repeat protein